MSNLYYEECTRDICRDLAMRAHGKFSVGSEFKAHKYAIEIWDMQGSESIYVNVWSWSDSGLSYDYAGYRRRFSTVVRKEQGTKAPLFARRLPEFLSLIERPENYGNISCTPGATKPSKKIVILFNLDFRGKIWQSPMVYVKGIYFTRNGIFDF